MGEIESTLKKFNPSLSSVVIQIYADALKTYVEARKNVEAYGAVVAHPRTGAPVENPYLKIRDAAGKTLERHPKVNAVVALALLEAKP